MNSLAINNQVINYQITYKKIKHLYFRYQNGIWQISAAKKFSQSEIIQYMTNHFDLLVRKQTKANNRLVIPKYSIFGVEYSQEDFYRQANLPNQAKYYQEVLKRALVKEIEQLDEWLCSKLSIVKLELVKTKFKKYKSRYGSCNIIKREITINTFMARIEIKYLKCVLLHEYAHLLVANHSVKFYTVLGQMLPNHYDLQKNLRKIPITFE